MEWTRCDGGTPQDAADFYVMINGYWDHLRFAVQERPGPEWKQVIDTALDASTDFCEAGSEVTT